MNLLADENVDGLVVQALRAAGHVVESIAEVAPSIAEKPEPPCQKPSQRLKSASIHRAQVADTMSL